MDGNDSISFSSVLAGMLLYQRNVKSMDIMKMFSDFSYYDIYADDSNDDLVLLNYCVSFNSDCSFSLKDGYDYDTVLSNGMMVYDFLRDVAGEKVLNFLKTRYQKMCFIKNNDNSDAVMVSNTSNKVNEKGFSRVKKKFGRFVMALF